MFPSIYGDGKCLLNCHLLLTASRWKQHNQYYVEIHYKNKREEKPGKLFLKGVTKYSYLLAGDEGYGSLLLLFYSAIFSQGFNKENGEDNEY